jgi:hypothetical protein
VKAERDRAKEVAKELLKAANVFGSLDDETEADVAAVSPWGLHNDITHNFQHGLPVESA